jgi:hypothetical protein
MAMQTRVNLYFDMDHQAQILTPLYREGWQLVAMVCDEAKGWIAYLEK